MLRSVSCKRLLPALGLWTLAAASPAAQPEPLVIFAAGSLRGVVTELAAEAGPALGVFVVAWLGADVNFLLNAASFLGVMVVLYEWRRQSRPGVLPAERVIGAIPVENDDADARSRIS